MTDLLDIGTILNRLCKVAQNFLQFHTVEAPDPVGITDYRDEGHILVSVYVSTDLENPHRTLKIGDYPHEVEVQFHEETQYQFSRRSLVELEDMILRADSYLRFLLDRRRNRLAEQQDPNNPDHYAPVTNMEYEETQDQIDNGPSYWEGKVPDYREHSAAGVNIYHAPHAVPLPETGHTGVIGDGRWSSDKPSLEVVERERNQRTIESREDAALASLDEDRLAEPGSFGGGKS